MVQIISLDFVSPSKKIEFAPQLEPNEQFEFDPNRSIIEQAAELPYNLAWEFPRSDVYLVRLIGMGCFGQVWEADSEGTLIFLIRNLSTHITLKVS